MAGFLYFKDAGILGEATEGSLLSEGGQPNGMGPEDYYNGWIRLNSVSQGMTRQIEEGHSGTARSRAGTVLKEVSVTKEVDCSTIELIRACAGGISFSHVFIHLCTSIIQRNVASLHPYLEFHLYSVKVTSYDVEAAGADDGSIPTETLSLNFDKVLWRYWPIGPTPANDQVGPNEVQVPTMRSGWDVLRSAPFDG
jgi:type VI protein secretion system component Hcp